MTMQKEMWYSVLVHYRLPLRSDIHLPKVHSCMYSGLSQCRSLEQNSEVAIKLVCVQLIEHRNQSAVGPGTIAGSDHREGSVGRHDPLDIVLLPTNVWRMEGRSEGQREERRTEHNDDGQKRKRKRQIGSCEGRGGKRWQSRHEGDS